MATVTYSHDLDVMVAQCAAIDTTIARRKDEQTLARLLLVASWKDANPHVEQAELVKATGISKAEISKACKVLSHYGTIGCDDVLKNVRAFMKNHVGERGYKGIGGIYTDLFGTEDNWTLEGAIDTLLKAADKRGIDRDAVMAAFVEMCEG